MLTTHVAARKKPSKEVFGHLKLTLNWEFN